MLRMSLFVLALGLASPACANDDGPSRFAAFVLDTVPQAELESCVAHGLNQGVDLVPGVFGAHVLRVWCIVPGRPNVLGFPEAENAFRLELTAAQAAAIGLRVERRFTLDGLHVVDTRRNVDVSQTALTSALRESILKLRETPR